MEEKRHNFDAHWKTIITELFEEFVLFFFPRLYPYIDFSVPPVSLQQELEKIIQDEKMEGKIINDKLVRVKLKNGEERCILIHIEIQSKAEADFAERMFRYFYRIYDRYKGERMTAIAVYTGERRPKVHDRFVFQEDGKGLSYTFHSYWVEEAEEEKLKINENPFALAVLAAKRLNHTKKKHQLRLDYKLELINLMKNRQYTPKQMYSLLTFIQLMLILPKEQELQFKTKFRELYIKEETMHPQDAKSLSDLGHILFEIGEGMTIESLLEKEREKAKREKENAKLEKEKAKREREKAKQAMETVNTIAKELIKLGLSTEQIVLATKLSLEKVLELKETLSKEDL